LIFFLFLSSFSSCWGSNPGPWACSAGTLPLSYNQPLTFRSRVSPCSPSSLELAILLLQPLRCCDYMSAPPQLARSLFLLLNNIDCKHPK
jgi:hypothetical protein